MGGHSSTYFLICLWRYSGSLFFFFYFYFIFFLFFFSFVTTTPPPQKKRGGPKFPLAKQTKKIKKNPGGQGVGCNQDGPGALIIAKGVKPHLDLVQTGFDPFDGPTQAGSLREADHQTPHGKVDRIKAFGNCIREPGGG